MTNKAPSVVRMAAPPTHNKYHEYKEYLRFDFWYSCAYCSCSEVELGGRSFAIDHYKPKSKWPNLVSDYVNLMWSCCICNSYKGDDDPTPAMVQRGYRYFRPDTDAIPDHFDLDGIRIVPASSVGEYTVEALDLNREPLRRLRDIRRRMTESHKAMLGGLKSLASAGTLDRLPKKTRAFVVSRHHELTGEVGYLEQSLASLLRDVSRSPALDEDPEARERSRGRRAYLKEVRAVVPEFPEDPDS